MRKIAKEHGCKIHFINTHKSCSEFDNPNEHDLLAQYCYREKKIIMGIFEHYEIKVYSFFHELGHSFEKKHLDLSRKKTLYNVEKRAWLKAEELMREYNIELKDDYYTYKDYCLKTYL
jgi:hypothetical protein